MKYNVISWGNLFFRHELDGNSLLIVNPYGHQVVLNKTANRILEHVKEQNETDVILDLLKKDYQKIDTRILENDMLELLRLLCVYQIIEWDTSDPRYLSLYGCEGEDFKFRIAGDEDYKFLSDYIINDGINGLCSSNVDYKDYYSPFSLRHRTFNNQEYYAYSCRNNQICACISVIPPTPPSVVLNITSFFKSNELSAIEFSECLNGMLRRLLSRFPDRIRKVRFNATNETNMDLIKLLSSYGFAKECVLTNEVAQGDLTMYTSQI